MRKAPTGIAGRGLRLPPRRRGIVHESRRLTPRHGSPPRRRGGRALPARRDTSTVGRGQPPAQPPHLPACEYLRLRPDVQLVAHAILPSPRYVRECARTRRILVAVIDDEQPARRAPARKDTKRWCKGKVGREHMPVVAMSHHFLSPLPSGKEYRCGWVLRGVVDGERRERWNCLHKRRCDVCERVLTLFGLGTDCPDYPGGGGRP